MATRFDSPQVTYLKKEVEKKYGRPVRTPSDFVLVADRVETRTREHISESTIKRLWKPRLGYKTISDHSLNVLAAYVGFPSFKSFCDSLESEGVVESSPTMPDTSIYSSELAPGDRVEIAWLPDRECLLEYKGENLYEVLEARNSTIQAGDSFLCLSFAQGRPLYVDHLQRGGELYESFGMGTEHGLTRVALQNNLQ